MTGDGAVDVFDLLVPLQYSEQDQRAGDFFGKDRRGRLHRVPLMTLSIGVVTNARRRFVLASQVSELATEMKSYAKSLQGSVFSIDRRSELAGDDVEYDELGDEESAASQLTAQQPGSAEARDSQPRPRLQQAGEGGRASTPNEAEESYAGKAPARDGRSAPRGAVGATRAIAQLGED